MIDFEKKKDADNSIIYVKKVKNEESIDSLIKKNNIEG